MSTLALDLREGDARDLDQVERLMAAAFDPRWGEAWTRNQVIGMLSLPGVWLTIAERGGSSLGFALTRATLDEAELLLLAVAPQARRGGIGAALLRTVVADCGGRGIATLHLEVREGNDAIRLYKQHGFAKVGERRDYYRGADGKSYAALTLQRPTR
ncbi:MAG: ribosomal protein S18-alanine N-acetyltransferase [Sphingomonas sp.]|uniref:ribosomal protein S18-alanine N-acetyltransferase n=1 Tax=Sphingomonas sp. TaxID=28214 RepID=UPI001AC19CC7|nr:ribosomal protein S18-alanine N-acetyltransferase [Sphingomonas sp.]MBN8806854.1 ribosomal protein S18-alanine N-acetyltransferase [Sphingomonas sp.]